MSNDAVRMSREALVNAIHAARGQVEGSAVRCPFHDDRNPSGSIHSDTQGVWRFTCHTTSCGFSGDVFDVLARAAGKKPSEILQERRSNSSPTLTILNGKKSQEPVKETVYQGLEEVIAGVNGRIEAQYEYKHPKTGAVELLIVRYIGSNGRKTFTQAYPVAGGWVRKAPPKPWPLYNRAGIREADPVVVVEGEKCAEALLGIGIPATTSPCGAGKAAYADWSPLAGKMVYLWPDNDEPGIKFMREVGEILHRLEPPVQVQWLDPAGLDLPPKGDVADYLESLGDVDQKVKIKAVLSVLGDAVADGAANEVDTILREMATGKRKTVSWPWPQLTVLSKALLPGTVTLICGEPGATKSFFILEALQHWHSKGIKSCVFELEEDKGYHLHRLLAQRTGHSEILDSDWVANNYTIVDQLSKANQRFLNSIGRVIWEAPDKQVTLKELSTWVRDRGRDGYRVIVVDPVTAAAQSPRPWIDDLEFLIDVKNAAREYKTSVVLVTHPRQTNRQSGVSIDNLAGSRAYPRFSQTVLWLERKQSDINAEFVDGGEGLINRSVHIVKARNGVGHGLLLGFYFYNETLSFRELGLMKQKGVRDAKKQDAVPAF